nr:hypothetical protein [Tanacetum cinerariifolium]
KDLLRACPHHGFTELHQLDTFYNALNPADQDSLNAAAGGNLLEKSPQDALTIIENKSKVRNSRSKPIASLVNACDNHSSSELAKLTHPVNQQTSAVTTAMTAMLKPLQSNPPPAQGRELSRAIPLPTELHQLDTFYNALNPADQDSLNAAAGGNLLEKSPQDALTIIENKSKVRNSRSKPIASPVNSCDNHSSSEIAKLTHAVNQQTSAVTTVMTSMLKQLQSNPPPAQVKAVEEICVICGGAHPYYQCLAAGGNTFLEFRDNIQGYVSAAVGNYNQGNPGYLPQGVANQMRPPGSGSLPGNTVANPKGELKAITTRSGLVTEGPTVPNPFKSVNLEEDECVEETYTDPNLAKYTIKVPPPPVQKPKPLIQIHFVLHTRDSPPLHISDPRVPLILGTPFLRTTRALIDVYGEEMILRDGDEMEIEFLLYQGEDSNFKDSIDQSDLANLDDLFVDPTPEMFTNEQPPDYSFPPRFDVYPDDFLEDF